LRYGGIFSGNFLLTLPVAMDAASGCASLEPSDDKRVTHSDDGRLAYVECVNSRHSWRLHCAGNAWRRVNPDTTGIGSCVEPTPPVDDNGGLTTIFSFHGTCSV